MSQPLKEISDPKDIIISNLKEQLTQYKNKMAQTSYENLTGKITELEKALKGRENEIKDLKSTSNAGGGSGDSNNLRTKMIILQSKVRASEQKLAKAVTEKEELEIKLSKMGKAPVDDGKVQVLKKQLRQEMETSDRLRNQLNRMSMENSGGSDLQQENQNLRDQIQRLQQQGGGGGGMNDEQVAQFQSEIYKRDQRIKELETEMNNIAKAGSAGPMANLRLQREINALKSQNEMLKKSEKEMRKKYEQTMRKQEFSVDDGW
jgi:DNA repair exonuclease SbcCD ATPase subunit